MTLISKMPLALVGSSIVIGCVMATAQAQSRYALMPQPAELTTGVGFLSLTTTFAVETPGVNDERLRGAIDRAMRRVETATGLPRAGMGNVAKTRLIAKVERPGDVVQTVDEDESYSLEITKSEAKIEAAT